MLYTEPPHQGYTSSAMSSSAAAAVRATGAAVFFLGEETAGARGFAGAAAAVFGAVVGGSLWEKHCKLMKSPG